MRFRVNLVKLVVSTNVEQCLMLLERILKTDITL